MAEDHRRHGRVAVIAKDSRTDPRRFACVVVALRRTGSQGPPDERPASGACIVAAAPRVDWIAAHCGSLARFGRVIGSQTKPIRSAVGVAACHSPTPQRPCQSNATYTGSRGLIDGTISHPLPFRNWPSNMTFASIRGADCAHGAGVNRSAMSSAANSDASPQSVFLTGVLATQAIGRSMYDDGWR